MLIRSPKAFCVEFTAETFDSSWLAVGLPLSQSDIREGILCQQLQADSPETANQQASDCAV
jgi:hypothetical protein